MGDPRAYNGPGVAIAADVLCLPLSIANVTIIGKMGAKAGEWVLVDAGCLIDRNRILAGVHAWCGEDRPPCCLILTHGHFDHVGSLEPLLDQWQVPVYAHPLELPYLTGKADYPPPDPTVGGGLMSLISPVYPHNGIDLGDRVKPLPADGSVPCLPDWRWVHTPGHTCGHCALFRESDRVLLSGDAFITVEQESAVAVLTRAKAIDGPPAYFTTDWQAAKGSVRKLAALGPAAVSPGHGLPMSGAELTHALTELADDFDEIAMPEHGRYLPPTEHPNP